MKPRNPNAFPTPTEVACEYNENGQTVGSQDGMTLRDYFANTAMLGILNNGLNTTEEHAEEAYSVVAKQSYLLADAMLKQREL